MRKIRVLVVDDSVVIRKVVAEELGADPAIEVVGTAANGLIALAKMTQVTPDVVILDVEMPELDGLATLKKLKLSHPSVPVIMFSALTEAGAAATLDALALGATDYFTKPAGGLDESRQLIRNQLAAAIKGLGPQAPNTPISAATKAATRPLAVLRPIEIVVIGVSTGGPNALMDVFHGLPADLPVPVAIVQHMPPMFTKLLAERLTGVRRVPVAEAAHGLPLAAGRAIIAPGDFHLTLARDGATVRAQLNQDAPENSCRPAVDPLFRTAATAYGPGVLAVVLTGMGQDGLRGAQEVRAGGGHVLAQDEATSVVWGMPGAVVRGGVADKVLPLPMVAGEIVRRVLSSRM